MHPTKFARLTALALTLAAASAAPRFAAADAIVAGKLEKGDRVAVLGDSITEQKNYSVDLEDYFLMCQPAAGLEAAQFGWGGETTWGFKGRIKQDVLWFKPDVATICYGMNDGGYGPLDQNRLKDYIDSTKEIVRKLKAGGVRLIVLAGPSPVDTDTYHGGDREGAKVYNKTLAALNKAAGDIAKQEGLGFADLHTVMSEGMQKFKKAHPGVALAGPDGVHPDNNGHLVMAYAILKALGCDGNLGSVTVDLKTGRATAEGGHKVLSMKGGAVEVESTRYPFVFANGPGDARGQQAGLDAVPFNAELNRYMLVVKNAPAKRMRVTWGRETKEFDAAALEKGINLAAEYMGQNPFRPAFERVDQAVREQQNFETPLTKDWLHNQPSREQNMPRDVVQSWAEIIRAGEKIDGMMRDAAEKAVAPVKHTIIIEPIE